MKLFQRNTLMILIKKKIIFIYLIFYISLLVGFYYGENSSGGAKMDYYLLQENFITKFFNNGVVFFLANEYSNSGLAHSPVFYILIKYLRYIFNDYFAVRLFFLHLYLFLPYIFWKILKINNVKIKFINLFPILFFISPYFRSVAIWSGREILAQIFFALSILFFLKYKKNNYEIFNLYLSLIFITISAYIMPEYGFLVFFFIYEIYNLQKKNLPGYLFLGIIFSAPFFSYYYYYFNFEKMGNFQNNILTNLNYFFSILFFYTIPFLFFIKKEIFIFFKKKILVLIIALFIFFIFRERNYEIIGGGSVLKLLHALNFENIFFVFSFLGFLSFWTCFNPSVKRNYILLIVLILQTTFNFHFFQKYLDPMWIIFFFTLFEANDKKLFINRNFILSIFFFNICFYFFALNYYN